MLKPALTALILSIGTATACSAADAVGFRQTILDGDGPRPLRIALWYPAEGDGPIDVIGENIAFVGIDAQRNATPDPRPHPLVLLSHGYGGNWRNLSWLAVILAEHGYIVAAPDHPGTTSLDRTPRRAAELWERPRDLSRVIDLVLDTPQLAGSVKPDAIAAIGHSLGGWTVAALAGARFDSARFVNDCDIHPELRACALASEFAIGGSNRRLDGDLSDPRLAAFVSLDLGLARGFSPDSLKAMKMPALIVSARIDIGGMSPELESDYLSAHLPTQDMERLDIADAMHFSFMQSCKPDAVDLLQRSEPGDAIVCKDGTGRDRGAIHRQVAEAVIAFLAKALAKP